MNTYKSLRVREETHTKIKTQAARLGMTIDEFLQTITAPYAYSKPGTQITIRKSEIDTSPVSTSTSG